MIIPKQKGTADSCVTENEEEIIGTQEKVQITLNQIIFVHIVYLAEFCNYFKFQ